MNPAQPVESWPADTSALLKASEPTLPDVYYDVARKDYWVTNARGEWISANETGVGRLLKECGFSARCGKENLSTLEAALLKFMRERDVAYGGPLAGYRKGIYEMSGQRILVTTSPLLIEAMQGDWPVLRKLLDGMFGKEQLQFVLGWLKVAYESLRDGIRRPGQALVLAGEHNSYKSFLQNVMTRILGGRDAKPYRYMSGATPFNGDLFGAEHLATEDEVPSTDIRARRNIGAQIKAFTVNESQSCHAKNRPALTLNPFWRLSISVNEEPENLMILPPMDDSLSDKLMLLRVSKQEPPMPTFTSAQRELFWKTVLSELPAFCWHLANWEIPEELRCDRFGIKHYHNADLLKAIQETAPETRLLAILDACFSEGFFDGKDFTGTAETLESRLSASAHQHEVRRLMSWANAMGTYLGRLARDYPERVMPDRTSSKRFWVIKPPAKDDGVTPSSPLSTPLLHSLSE